MVQEYHPEESVTDLHGVPVDLDKHGNVVIHTEYMNEVHTTVGGLREAADVLEEAQERNKVYSIAEEEFIYETDTVVSEDDGEAVIKLGGGLFTDRQARLLDKSDWTLQFVDSDNSEGTIVGLTRE